MNKVFILKKQELIDPGSLFSETEGFTLSPDMIEGCLHTPQMLLFQTL